ncbi:PAS domain-containing protein, partial [bacterium]|nr:PAS domain-containing protein [bacterium]
FEAQAKSEKTLAKNLPCLKKDGTLIYVDFSTTTSIIDGVKCNIGFTRDVTKKREMEIALRKSEESLKEAQKIAKLGNWEWDIKSDLTLWSDELYRIFDKNPEEFELKSKNTLDCINPDDIEIMSQALNSALSGNKTYDIEYRIILENGAIHFIHEKGEVFYDEDKKPIRMIGTCQDITERKMVEEQIRKYSISLEKMVKERTEHLDEALNEMEKSKEQVDGILKAMPEGLIYTDTNNRIILMNSAAEDLLNTRLSNVINKSIDYAIEDKTLRDRFNYTLDKKMTGYQFDFTLPSDDPEHPKTLRATTSVLRDKLESLRGIVTIIQDVTHEREVDRMKTEFITTAAHELRSPLTAIRGFSEILLTKEGYSPEKVRKFLTHINKGAESLTNIINDLLDVSRLESGKGYMLNKSWCNIDSLIEESISDFSSQIKIHSFEYVPSESSEEVYVDREKIKQVMTNLLSNAIKYSPGGGLIKVVCEYQIIYYIVSVEDHGIGMKLEHAEKVFEKFFRVDSSNTSVEGTGLGMSIVKYIVDAHEGRVWVESKFGEGTKVSFVIPINYKDKKNNIGGNSI